MQRIPQSSTEYSDSRLVVVECTLHWWFVAFAVYKVLLRLLLSACPPRRSPSSSWALLRFSLSFSPCTHYLSIVVCFNVSNLQVSATVLDALLNASSAPDSLFEVLVSIFSVLFYLLLDFPVVKSVRSGFCFHFEFLLACAVLCYQALFLLFFSPVLSFSKVFGLNVEFINEAAFC